MVVIMDGVVVKTETLPDVQKSLQTDFENIKEVFQIDEVGVIRLSKLVPEHTDNEEIFNPEFKRKIDFYKNFLGVDIRVNITENELFAGYKKVSIDIDGKHNTQVWNHIMKNIIPTLELEGFKKSFISLEILRDLPKEVLDDYMKLVSADFVLEKGNIIKDIVLWLENALATKYSKEKGLGEISDIIRGNSDLEHLMMMIAHVSKMDNEFKQTLELLYIKLVRYKDPKVQGLLRFLGHNVDKNVSEKKLIDKARSKFSIGISRVLGSIGIGNEKKALPNPSKGGEMDWTTSPSEKPGRITAIFDKAKKLGNSSEGYQKGDELTENELKELNRLFNIDGIRLLTSGSGYYVDSGYYEKLEKMYNNVLNDVNIFHNLMEIIRGIFIRIGLKRKDVDEVFGFAEKNNVYNNKKMLPHFWEILKNYLVKTKNITFVKGLKKSLGTDVIINGRKNKNYIPEIDWSQGAINLSNSKIVGTTIDLTNVLPSEILSITRVGDSFNGLKKRSGNKLIFDKNFTGGNYDLEIETKDGEKYLLHFVPWPILGPSEIRDASLRKLEQKENTPQISGGIRDFGSYFDDVSTQVSHEVIELLSQFNGIESLEEAFLNRKTLDIKSVFNQNISTFLSGKIFFDKDGFLFLDGNLHLQTIIENSDFGILVRGLLDGNFDAGNVIIEKEKLTFTEFLDFVREMQSKLTHYLEKDTKNGIAKLLQDNIEVFKNDENKRKYLLYIITSKKQEFNPELIETYRELGKVDKEFRKIYTLSSIPKVEKIQVLKTLLERNNLAIIDVWGYLNKDLKDKFFAPFSELFDYETEEKRFNELLDGVKKELKYLLGDDIYDVLSIFEGLYGDDNWLSLKMDINEFDTSNIIMKDLQQYFFDCVEKREDQINSTKEKIEERMRGFEEILTDKRYSDVFNIKLNYDKYGYASGDVNIKIIEQSKHTQDIFSRLGFIIDGKLDEKLHFEKITPDDLKKLVAVWDNYLLFIGNYLCKEDFIDLLNETPDDELNKYVDDVYKILTTYKYRDEIFADSVFARQLLYRFASLDERFRKELVFLELRNAMSLADIIDFKKHGFDVTKEDFDRYVSKELQDGLRNNLLKYIKEKDKKNLEYCLQLDGENFIGKTFAELELPLNKHIKEFLEELLSLDLKNRHELSKFTSKYRGQGIIITKICVIIDNLIAPVQNTRALREIKRMGDDIFGNSKRSNSLSSYAKQHEEIQGLLSGNSKKSKSGPLNTDREDLFDLYNIKNEINPIIDKYITPKDTKIFLEKGEKDQLIYNIIKNLDEK